jgi:hypothetical protein
VQSGSIADGSIIISIIIISSNSSSSSSNNRSTLRAKEEKRNFLHKNNKATNLDPNTTNFIPA